MCVCSFCLGEDELEVSPYDDTQMDTRMASLVAGKMHYHTSHNTFISCYDYVACVCVHQLHTWSVWWKALHRCVVEKPLDESLNLKRVKQWESMTLWVTSSLDWNYLFALLLYVALWIKQILVIIWEQIAALKGRQNKLMHGRFFLILFSLCDYLK